MRRSVFAIAFLCTILSAGTLFAAMPGMTAAGRSRASEFRKRLVTKKLPRKLRNSLTLIYLRRAYIVDTRPALAMVSILLRPKLELKEPDRIKYFAMCLDALIRGAGMKDLEATLESVTKASYGRKDTALFIESFLGVASRQASPASLAALVRLVTKNGMVGKRRREFVTWVLDKVERGENPEYILKIYDGIDKIVFSIRGQREYLTKCYDAIQRGAPPLALSTAVVRIAPQLQTGRQLNEKTDEILRRHFRGTPLAEAAAKVVPPPKKEKQVEVEDY